jgi:ABC-type glycerol-3-phosphate transport system substrate-binding protein
MFAAMNAKYPDVEIVENPVPGGGGTEHRVVLKARITAGIPPDTFQTLGGAELKDYVDSGVLEPLDDWYAASGYGDVIRAVTEGKASTASVFGPVEHASGEHPVLQQGAVRRTGPDGADRLR